MGFNGVKKALWILITFLPLAFIVHADEPNKKIDTTPSSATTTTKTTTIAATTTTAATATTTTAATATTTTAATTTTTTTEKAQITTINPYNATEENNSSTTLDYGMDYYEYPLGLFRSYNDTDDLGTNNETYYDNYEQGTYYNGYYNDYYGSYAYPEFYYTYYDRMVEASSTDVTQTLMTTVKQETGTKKPKVKRVRRKTRSIPEESNMKHLCVAKLLNVTNVFNKYIRHIVECQDKESKYFACLNSKGFIKPCYLLKSEKKPEVPLCIQKENSSHVTTCNSPEPQSFCFTDPKEMNRIIICNGQTRRVCFNRGLAICSNQDKKRVPREATKEEKWLDLEKDRAGAICKNCEVEVRMLVDESEEVFSPKVQIKVSKLDSLEKIMDAVGSDYDK